MRRACLLGLLVTACTPHQSPSPSVAPQPVHPPPALVEPTCADAAAILRRALTADSAQLERAIGDVCTGSRWTSDTIACVTGGGGARCLDAFEAQRDAYRLTVRAWAYGGREYGGRPGIAFSPDAVSCRSIDPSRFPPVVESDRAWAASARRSTLPALCELDHWDDRVKECLFNEHEGTTWCLDLLDDVRHGHVTTQLAAFDKLEQEIATARRAGTRLDCTSVSGSYYNEPHWRGALDPLKPAARTKQIARARARMARACTAEGWDDDVRACIAVDGGEPCFAAGAIASSRWGFSASAGPPAACDDYADAVARARRCETIPQAAKDAITTDLKTSEADWGANADQTNLAASCKTALDRIVHDFKPRCAL
jgi:hypothetical protein